MPVRDREAGSESDRSRSLIKAEGLEVIVQAVLIGMLVMLAGTIPRNLAFSANLKYYTSVPWAVPLIAAYLWLFWR